MQIKQKFVALVLALFMVADLSAQTAPVSGGPITLQSAVDQGLVEYSFNGTGASSGDSIKLKVKKTAKARGPLTVTVPPGSVLRSSEAGAQSMVVGGVRGVDMGGGMFTPTSQIYLGGVNPITLILTAFCAEFEKDNPSSSTTFSLEKPDSTLSCIVRQSAGMSLSTRQAAVWIYTDHVSYSHMSEKFPVESAEFSSGEGVARRCQAAVR